MIGVFARSDAELPRARKAVEQAGLKAALLDKKVSGSAGHVSVGTMHVAKGLEFGTVVVMACDDEVIPLQERIEAIGDEADLQKFTIRRGTFCTSPARGRVTTSW